MELIALARQKAMVYCRQPGCKYAPDPCQDPTHLRLDGDLVCAIAEQESSWNPWEIRFEPGFLSKYIVPIEEKDKIRPTEAYARSFSWGLMQVMGEDAREDGFTGVSLAELCDPPVGLDAGCKRFARIVRRVGAIPDAQSVALLHWNGGADPNYPCQVLARLPAYNA
ncbi:MAG TPA: transglycosylase SLT domain-containing protein [Bryobacteraceae bacterium]|nr:transglycosylase SLT domain-containing protein [Bryobacteraceae bacterium]